MNDAAATLQIETPADAHASGPAKIDINTLALKNTVADQAISVGVGNTLRFGAVGGICHLLALSSAQTAHAISLAATNGVPLRASRARRS